MKQLLIVDSAQHTLNAKGADGSVTGKDLSGLNPGAIAFGEVGSASVLSGLASKNFWIALGRPNGQVPMLIPEVDIHSLTVTKSVPVAATQMSIEVTMPTPSDVAEIIPTTSRVISPIAEYGMVFIKKGTVPHERNTWTVQIASQVSTAANLATAMAAAINAKHSELFPFTASVSSSTHVVVTCDNYGEDWEVRFIDNLEGINDESKTFTYYPNSTGSATSSSFVTGYTSTSVTFVAGRKAIGDKADIQDLASRCAAGKGFTDTQRMGESVYPNYPETVEDKTYNVYTLRFRVGRDSAKTRDERVWQIVHIAVPTTYGSSTSNSSFISAIEAIIPAGNYMANVNAANVDAAIDEYAETASGSGTT